MADELILRSAGGRAPANLNQMTALKQPERLLHGGFREAAGFGDLAEAHGDATFAGAKERGPEHEIDKKCGSGAVMADQIGEENVEHVLVDCDVGTMIHRTIVPCGTGELQRERMTGKNACQRRER